MVSRIGAIAVVAGTLITAHVSEAGVIYDNGPANGTIDAWTINFGYAVADSFSLAAASILTGASFTLWNLPRDATATVDWSVVANPTTGPILAFGTASVSQDFQFTNDIGYDVNSASIALPNIVLGPGTYWFELQNASVSNGDPAYWDMNGGPSQIWDSDFGYNPDPSDVAPGLGSASTRSRFSGFLFRSRRVLSFPAPHWSVWPCGIGAGTHPRQAERTRPGVIGKGRPPAAGKVIGLPPFISPCAHGSEFRFTRWSSAVRRITLAFPIPGGSLQYVYAALPLPYSYFPSNCRRKDSDIR